MLLTRQLLRSTFNSMRTLKALWAAVYIQEYDRWALYNREWDFYVWCSKWCHDEEQAQRKADALNRIYA